MLLKVAGLIFTYKQISQLAKHLNPRITSQAAMFLTVIRMAHDRNCEFIAYGAKTKEGRVFTRFILSMYCTSPMGTETTTHYKRFAVHPKVPEAREWFANHGVQGHIPYDTLIIDPEGGPWIEQERVFPVKKSPADGQNDGTATQGPSSSGLPSGD